MTNLSLGSGGGGDPGRFESDKVGSPVGRDSGSSGGDEVGRESGTGGGKLDGRPSSTVGVLEVPLPLSEVTLVVDVVVV